MNPKKIYNQVIQDDLLITQSLIAMRGYIDRRYISGGWAS